ncbi:MAG: hypothetical protein J2P41_11160, partial [Blastocatellia bacterium]|nr:hypothetical protein [Blastocatellia bacterium]
MGEVRHYRSLPALFVISGSFALLGLLALLQFHWQSQLSSDERVRMGSALEANVAHFCEDFDRELARAWVAFRMDGATLRDRKWANFGERYERWIKQSPHPRLVNALFLITEDDEGRLQANQFDPAARTFSPSAVPSELLALRQKLQQQMEKQLQSESPPGHYPPQFAHSLFPLVFAESPLLLIPVIPLPGELSPPHSLPPGKGTATVRAFTFDEVRAERYSFSRAFSYILVRLDTEYMRDVFIPELARRYFGADGNASEYQISIISRNDPAQVFYSTASTPLRAAAADASGKLLTLRPELVENFSFDLAHLAGAGGMVAGKFGGRSRRAIVTKTDSGGLNRAGKPGIEIVRTADSGVFFAHTPIGFPLKREGSSWQLLVNHRAGSLNDAVEKLRRENLLISFSILLLLAASAVLIYFSAHRARRLAHQQIEFVAGVSHELRVPVSVVCLTSANLADGLIRDSQQVESYGRLIHGAGRRLAQSIEQVLDFAGAEMIRKPYQFSEVDVEQLIGSALDSCRAEWDSAGFAVKTTIAKPLPKVWGDRTALGTALQNLISNAVKYSGDSRQIEVGAEF